MIGPRLVNPRTIGPIIIGLGVDGAGLSYNFYEQSCPQAENIVKGATTTVFMADPAAPSALLRLMFHDCQVQGCDASILVDEAGTGMKIASEVSAAKNFGVGHRDSISYAKSVLESECPGQVSCSDVIILAARDAVAFSGGPYINVPLGRRDSSNSPSDTLADSSLPPSNISVGNMLLLFANKGMTVEESVAIMGAVLGSVSIHTLSILPVPKVVLNGIERLMRNFIWDRGSTAKHHWVNWDSICKPKDEGGLGIRKLSEVKECLLNKLAWKFLLNNSIWAKYARSKYLYSSYSSTIWSAIKPFILKLRRDSFWEIGRGDILLSHFSEWFGVRLPKVARDWTIKEVISDNDIKSKFLLMPTSDLHSAVCNTTISDSPDKLVWRGAASGMFSTKACYEKIRVTAPKRKIYKHLWHMWLPPKISVFVWKIWHNAVPTDDNISRCGISLASRCWCCVNRKREGMEHLFISSDLAKFVWKFVALIFDKPIPGNLKQLQKDWFEKLKRKNYLDCLSLCIAACGLWEIWLNRNNNIHGNPCVDVKVRLRRWAKSLGPKINAVYAPSFRNQLILDTFHLPMPSSNIKGIWRKWCPSSYGNTLSLAVNNFRCGGILRDASGTFKLGFKVALERDDFYEGLISALLLLRVESWQLNCIQSSNDYMKFLSTEAYVGDWDQYGRWREARSLLNNTKTIHVPAALNDAAIALCFQNSDNCIFYTIRQLSKAVRLALVSDYINLPVWCRIKGKEPDSEDENEDSPRELRPNPAARHHDLLD